MKMFLFQTVIFILCAGMVQSILILEKNASFDNLICQGIGQTFEFGLSRSKIDCSSYCEKEANCRGFFFNKNVKSCHGVDVVLRSTNGCISSLGNVFYLLIGPYSSACSVTSECTTSNVICLEGKCRCEAGYSFEPTTQLCVTECLNYGTNYTKYSDMLMSTTAFEEYMPVNITQCQAHCAISPSCLGFNYSGGMQRCRLKFDTPLTSPDAWKSYRGVDYYKRNCA